jgi:hypothetical protein
VLVRPWYYFKKKKSWGMAQFKPQYHKKKKKEKKEKEKEREREKD